MKIFLLAGLIFSLTSCNVYNSEPREFITTNGVLQSGKIVISSTDKIETSYCNLDPSENSHQLPEPLITGSVQGKDFKIYQPEQQELVVHLQEPQNTLSCIFNLKDKEFAEDNLTYVLDLSIEAFNNSY